MRSKGKEDMQKTKSIYESIFYACLLLLPVFAQYSFFGNLIDLDVIVMVAFLFFGILRHDYKLKISRTEFAYIVYTAFICIFGLLGNSQFASPTTIILRCGRYLLYWMIILLYKRDFDYFRMMSIYKKISYLALIYLLMQYMAYYGAEIVLPCKIGGTTRIIYDTYGRFSSFYSEPADLAYSLIPFVTCCLFGPSFQNNKSEFKDAILISLAVVLSTSSQGTVCLLIVWCVWSFHGLFTRSISVKEFSVIFVAIFGFAIINTTGIISYALGRLSGGMQGTAWAARSGGYKALELLTKTQRIFGVGFGNYMSENAYGLASFGNYINFSTLSESLFTNGIMGTLLLGVVLLKSFVKGMSFQKATVLIIAILGIGGCPLSGKYLGIFLPLLLYNFNVDQEFSNESAIHNIHSITV